MRTPDGDTELVRRLTEIVHAAPSLMRVLTTVRSFDLPVIQRYFAEFEGTIGKRLG